MADQTWDVFISYAHKDADWVQNLADNLYQADFEVFIDSWEIAPGDVLVHKIDEGILKSKTGILVVSPEALSRPWVLEEYAAMMNRAVEGKQRLIPVLLADAEMPPLLASRIWIDFRNAFGPEYERNFAKLVRTLKWERPDRPERNGRISLPTDDPFRPEGPIYRTLQISKDKVSFLGGVKEASHQPRGLQFEDEQRIYELKIIREKSFSEDDYSPRSEAALDGSKTQMDDATYGKLLEAGSALTNSFLFGEAGSALQQAIKDASALNASLKLALEIIDDDLADLPWETLRIPEGDGQLGDPLALHSKIQFYRSVSGLGAAPAVQIPGPLRILVAIGSPEAQNRRGELLDMERETERILDAVQKARDEGKAYVRILETGSVKAINAALSEQRYHVLHISCHAEPGKLILEKENGTEDGVSAVGLSDEALPADRSPNLVVLAGCSTGVSAADGETQLAPFARGLLERGIPAVVAMQAPVSDRYATEYGAVLYRQLSTTQLPDPLSAASYARLSVEKMREAEENQLSKIALTEWATPALYLRGPSLPLYDPLEEFEEISTTATPVFTEGICVRSVGEFIGRRRSQRIILNTLRKKDNAGVLIHGIGGCGKSSLAAQIFHRLVQDGWFPVSLTGPMTVEAVLEEMGQRLLSLCISESLDEKHPFREVSRWLKQPDLEWEQRIALLSENVLSQLKLALLLDNFEDNLAKDRTVLNEGPQRDLAALLSRWINNPGQSRLVFTSRYPIKLPDEVERRLLHWHLGPLSFSETRKLAWRLSGLDALDHDELKQAYVNVGGHPRALEYLDALLRGGKARFADVEQRLKKAILKNKGIEDPDQWCNDIKGDFDQALAETITLAADDVLLDELLERLKEIPLASGLLYGASVHRLPVDQSGLAWQIGEEIELPDDPERTSRIQQINEKIAETIESGREPSIENLAISPEQLQQYQKDISEVQRPPLSVPEAFKTAMDALLENSLLSMVQYAEDDPLHFIVHRWTANALQRRMSVELTSQAHLRAGRYWDWWVGKVSKSISEYLEARYHFYQAGDLNKAVSITYAITDQLHTWGSWQQEEALFRESLAWLPEHSQDSAGFMHNLGIIAQHRGDYDEALDWFRKALYIDKEMSNRAGSAQRYYHIGIVANHRGDYDEALDWFRKALYIDEELGNRAGLADCYIAIGIIADHRGDYDEALDWYRKALDIFEELGNRAGLVSCYHNMGNIADVRGDYDEALDWFRKALDINEELGDHAGLAGSYHQLGDVALNREAYDEALDWYRKALDINEELGNRTAMAANYGQMGNVANDRGAADKAQEWFRKSLDINEELGNLSNLATNYHQMGNLARSRGAADEALEWFRKSLDISEELGNRVVMARSYHEVGNVAYGRGDYDEALDWYRKALDIFEELGNRVELAANYGQMGNLARSRGAADEALEWFRKSLDISEDLGKRTGMATCYIAIGDVAAQRSDYDEARDWFRKALDIYEELGDHAGLASCYHDMGKVAYVRGDYDEALDWYRKSLAINKELGNRAVMALSMSQMGNLLIDLKIIEEAIPLHLGSLMIRLELDVPEVINNMQTLENIKERIGDDKFRQAIEKFLPPDEAQATFNLLESLRESNKSE